MMGAFGVIHVNSKELYVDNNGRLAPYKSTEAVPESMFSDDKVLRDMNDRWSLFTTSRTIRLERDNTTPEDELNIHTDLDSES